MAKSKIEWTERTWNIIKYFRIFLLSKFTGVHRRESLRSFSFKSRVSQKRKLRGASCKHRQNSAIFLSKNTGFLS